VSLQNERRLQFEHERIDDDPPAARMGFCLTSDLTGNECPDIIIGALGRKAPVTVPVLDKRINLGKLAGTREIIDRLEYNVFWYENPGWERHDVAKSPELSVGAALGDVDGDGRAELVTGQNINQHDLYWFEQAADPRDRWTRRLITDDFEKYHDVAVADVDDDGDPEVLALSQESETVFYYDVPADPTLEPWPVTDRHLVAEDLNVEGVQVLDIDGDGRTEIVAGPNVYHRDSEASTGWRREPIVTGWDNTRVAVADLDGDGDLEVILSEGDSPHLGSHPGRVAWFDPPDWEQTVLKDGLFCPHTLEVADFTGDGVPDVYIAEMGLGKHDEPRHFLLRNLGDGRFEEETVATGIETHEATAVDVTGDGTLDVVGKSYGPDHHVDVWYNEA